MTSAYGNTVATPAYGHCTFCISLVCNSVIMDYKTHCTFIGYFRCVIIVRIISQSFFIIRASNIETES